MALAGREAGPAPRSCRPRHDAGRGAACPRRQSGDGGARAIRRAAGQSGSRPADRRSRPCLFIIWRKSRHILVTCDRDNGLAGRGPLAGLACRGTPYIVVTSGRVPRSGADERQTGRRRSHCDDGRRFQDQLRSRARGLETLSRARAERGLPAPCPTTRSRSGRGRRRSRRPSSTGSRSWPNTIRWCAVRGLPSEYPRWWC